MLLFLGGVLPVGGALAGTAQATEPQLEIDLLPGSLKQALECLAQQTGLQLLYDPEIIRGRTARRVKGTMTARQALRRLLTPTDVAFKVTEADAAALFRKPPAADHGSHPGTQAAAPPGDQAPVQQLVVTATRFNTSLQQTPLSMSALSSDTLLLTNVRRISDVILQVPSLSAEDLGPGNKRYAIRNVQAPGEPEVGLYYDEIPIAGLTGVHNDSGNQQPDPDLVDVERIEVLKGPQGTLFGEGSMGGTIRVISKRPDLREYQAAGQANLGSVAHGGINKEGDGMLNVPLIEDRLAFRIVAYYDSDTGYIHEIRLGLDDANAVISSGARASLRAQLGDTWTIDLIAYDQTSHSANTAQQMPYYGEWTAADFSRTPLIDRFHAYNLISVTDLPFASLTVLGSYQQRRVKQVFDLTPSTISVVSKGNCDVLNYVSCLNATHASYAFSLLPDAELNTGFVRAWSGEVRLQSPASSPVKWTVGSFFQKSDAFNQVLVGGPTNPDGSISIDPTTGLASGSLFGRQNWDPLRQEAAFGEITYPITSTFDGTVGVRHSHGQRSDEYDQIQNFGGTPFGPNTGLYPRTTYHGDKTTPKAELAYHPDEHHLYYVLAAEGFRLGGPNVLNTLNRTYLSEIPPSYKSDSLWNYELGSKTSFLDKRLTVDAALYWMDWSNIQVNQTDPTGAFQYTGNGGRAVANGAEFEFEAKPTSNLTFAAGVDYTHAALVGPQPVEILPQNLLRSGEPIPFTPKWTSVASATCRVPIASGLVYFRGEMSYRGGQTTAFNPDNINGLSPAYYQLPGFWLANIRGGLELDRYSAQLYITNLLDRRTQLSGVPQSGDLLQVVSTPPRTVGVLLRAKL
jgi:outer membrane receptor protein involved in Fe transport